MGNTYVRIRYEAREWSGVLQGDTVDLLENDWMLSDAPAHRRVPVSQVQ